ncbi:unnamed protein product [Linum trigynum]|uniref:Uncharacterized protein n=1 Tax=Linum trigynum TaxID=586398 RepID=A0AAV2ES58_9ROSI
MIQHSQLPVEAWPDLFSNRWSKLQGLADFSFYTPIFHCLRRWFIPAGCATCCGCRRRLALGMIASDGGGVINNEISVTNETEMQTS